MTASKATATASVWLEALGAALAAQDIPAATALFGDDVLLARPRQLHLEHQAPSRAVTAIAAMLAATLRA